MSVSTRHALLRFSSISLPLLLASAPPANGQDDYFGWSISNSATNPYANSGAPEQAYSGANLYLWLVCASCDLRPPDDGWSAADLGFELMPGPDGAFPVSYSDLSGSAIANPYPDLQLVAPPGCPPAPTLIGVFGVPADPGSKVQDFALCFRDYMGPGSVGFSRTVDCPSNGAEAHAIEWIGFRRGSVSRCRTWNFCVCGLGIADKSWGDLKGLYR